MSKAQNDIYLENLIERWREVSSIVHSEEGNGEYDEGDLEQIEEELLDLGINPEDLQD